MRFSEMTTPSIIQQAGGGDMNTTVLAWIEPNNGRLLRAEITVRDARLGVIPFDAKLRVDFRHDAKLNLLVPASMTETFFVDRTGDGTGTATYSNFRRFTTSARIIPQ